MKQSVAVGLTLIASAQGFAPHGGLLCRRQQRTAKLRQGGGGGGACVQGYGAAGSSTEYTGIKADSLSAWSLGGGRRGAGWRLSAVSPMDVAEEGSATAEAVEAAEGEKPKKKKAAVSGSLVVHALV